MYDWMHSKYLGTDTVILGAALWLLCFKEMDASPKENLKVAWLHIQEFQKQHCPGTSYKLLKLSMFCRKQGPHRLRGKAAEIKNVGSAILSAWQMFADLDTLQNRKIEVVLKLTCKCEEILRDAKGDYWLEDTQAAALTKAIFSMFHAQQGLAEEFKSKGDSQLFTVTAKAHYLCHCALQSKFLSPRVVWCFSGEDQMKRLRQLSAFCFQRLAPWDATGKILTHYRIAQHFLLDKVETL